MNNFKKLLEETLNENSSDRMSVFKKTEKVAKQVASKVKGTLSGPFDGMALQDDFDRPEKWSKKDIANSSDDESQFAFIIKVGGENYAVGNAVDPESDYFDQLMAWSESGDSEDSGSVAKIVKMMKK